MESLSPLRMRIKTAPHQFEFVQLLRILWAADRDRALVGTDSVPNREFVRLEARTATDFPAAEVYDLTGDLAAGETPHVQVNFLGLAGSMGALPRFYADVVLERLAKKDATLSDFLDLFNHRLLSLFFRAWMKYRFWVDEEQAGLKLKSSAAAATPGPIAQALLATTGLLGQGVLQKHSRGFNVPRLKVSDASFQYFAGFLSAIRRPARSLEQALRFLFSWPVSIDSFVGRWLHLDASEQTRLGSPRTSAIGVSAVVGSKVWDVQSMFRVQNGPLTYPQFQSLLPVGSAYRVLTEFTRLYVGAEFDFSLGLELRSEEVPRCRVGQTTGMGPRLGWNTWLCSRPIETPSVSVEIQVRTT